MPSPFLLCNEIYYNSKSFGNYSIWGLGRHKGKFILNKYSSKTLIEQLCDNQSILHINFRHKFSNETTPKFIYGEHINYKEYKYSSSNKEKVFGES